MGPMMSSADNTRDWMRENLTRVDSPMSPEEIWWRISGRRTDDAKEKNWSDAELVLALGLDRRDLITTCREIGIALPDD